MPRIQSERSRYVPTETPDPWRGQTMRLPIGVMATIHGTDKPESILAGGWLRFLKELAQPQRRRKRASA